jgi:hypothetical protein
MAARPLLLAALLEKKRVAAGLTAGATLKGKV